MTNVGLMYDWGMTPKMPPRANLWQPGTTAPEAPPFDIGNRLLSPQVTDITVTPANTPAGPRMILTVRTPTSTTTVFLEREESIALGRQLIHRAPQVSSLIVPNGSTPTLPPPVGM